MRSIARTLGNRMEGLPRMRRCLYSICCLITLAIPSTAHAAGVVATTTANVNVRKAPGGEVIGSLGKGTAVAAIGHSNGWVQVVYLTPKGEGKHGWVSIEYLRAASGSASRAAPRPRAYTGDSCESEYRSGAEVCVSVSDASIDCSESFAGDYYSGCEVTVDYEVSTDYEGSSSLDVDVECEVEISYHGREMYLAGSYSDSQSESHSLFAYDSESSSMSFDASFSSLHEVTRARVSSAECSVSNVDLW